MQQEEKNHSFKVKVPASQTVEFDLKADCWMLLLMKGRHCSGEKPALFLVNFESEADS